MAKNQVAPPPGYTLDAPPQVQTGTSSGAPPPGYTLDQPQAQGQVELPNGGQVSSTEPTQERYSTSLLKSIPAALGNVGVGALKGLGHTATAIPAMAAQMLPAKYVDPAKLAARDKAFAPQGTAQSLGYGGEQVGEFMAPGMGEASALAKAGKFAPLARMGYQAMTTGAVNKLQGGDFSTGALAGGFGGVIGEGMKAVAPSIAETAMGVRNTDRAYSRTPGQAILNETTGFRPGTIADQAQTRLGDLATRLNSNADASPTVASLYGPRKIAQTGYDTAISENNPPTIRKANQLQNLLWAQQPTGATIPMDITARRVLDLKRGVGDLKNSWNPATASDLADRTQGLAYGALDKEVDRTIPEAAALNPRIASLMPVASRAAAKDLNAGLLQRTMGRFGTPTGALAGTLTGGYAGYHQGGVPGMFGGAAMGSVLPELMSSPYTQMLAARGLASPISLYGLKGAAAAGLQLDRKPKPQ